MQELVRLLRVPFHSQARFTHDSSILNRADNLFEDIVRFLQTPGRVVSHFSLDPPIARAIGVLTSIVGGCRVGGHSWVLLLGAMVGCHCTVLHFDLDMFNGLFTTPRYR